jgi:peptidyl-prolyl cis-trans isomerase D
MTLLTKIRNRSGLLVTIIALALLIFILESALESSRSFSAGDRTRVGEINGREVNYEEFEAKVEQAEQNEKTRTGKTTLEESYRDNLRQQVWNQFLMDYLMKPRFEEIGLGVGADELFDMVQGKDPHPSVKQAFTDPATQQFNPQQVITFLKNLDKDETGETKNRWIQFELAIKDERLSSKYNTMIKKGLYVTRAEAKRDHASKNTQYNIRLLAYRYNSVADSTVKVTEDDMQRYYNENKQKYRQQITMRGIDFVQFDAFPSAEDRNTVLEKMNKLKPEFIAAEVDSDFVNRNSDTRFVERFVPRAGLTPVLDTLFLAPEKTVIGPYMENNTYKMAKLSGSKMVPDSVKARHILIKPEGAVTIDKAKAQIDSLKKMIESKQAKFDDLARTTSQDPGSATKGGDLGWFREGMMVPPFNDACFNGKVGELYVVETQFGVHLIEVMDKGPLSRKILISYIEMGIQPSSRTLQGVFAKASEFAGKNNSKEKFEKAVKEQNLMKRSAQYIKELDRNVNGIENSREIVRWAYEAKKGDVSKVFELDNKYIVAMLTSIKEKGVLPLEEVREQVEAEAKKQKKADQFIANFEKGKGSAKDLGEISAKIGVPLETVSNVTFSSPIVMGQSEPEVVGKMMALGTGKMLGPVKGDAGVYMIQVDQKVDAKPLDDIKSVINQIQPTLSSRVDYAVFEALKDIADVEDNRAKFF